MNRTVLFTNVSGWTVAILAAVGVALFPMISDDLNSIHAIRDTFIHGAPIDWNAYRKDVVDIFVTNHFRLPNLIMPLMALLPKWIPAMISAVALWYILFYGAKLGRFENRPSMSAAYMSGMIFAFPWIDQLYQVCFQMPYLWGAAAALAVVSWLMGVSHRKLPLFTTLSFLLGFWQEAYAGAVLGGCICLTMFYRDYRCKYMLCIIIALVGGITVAALPLIVCGHWAKWAFFDGRIWLILPFLFPSVAYLVFACAVAVRNKSLAIEPLNLFLAEIVVASLIMTVYFKTGARVNGFGTVCGLIGIFMLWNRLMEMKAAGSSGTRGILAACCIVALVAAHLVAVDVMCAKLARQTAFVVRHCRKEWDGAVFAEMTLREDVPWYLLQKPYYDWFAHGSTMGVFNRIYDAENGRLRAVPAQLREFSVENSRTIPGTAGLMLFGKYLVGRGYVPELSMDFGYGMRHRPLYRVEFSVAGDTARYQWVHPDNAWPDFMLHPEPLRADTIE